MYSYSAMHRKTYTYSENILQQCTTRICRSKRDVQQEALHVAALYTYTYVLCYARRICSTEACCALLLAVYYAYM